MHDPGCLAASVLGRQGYDAHVFERSESSLVDRGAAVGIPASLYSQLNDLDLIDRDTPHLELEKHRDLAQRPGRGLVSNAPDWNAMSATNMPEWWDNLLSETPWYADVRD